MTEKILIIDDEDDIVQLLKIRLQACGYTVVSATEVTEGIRIACQELPDLVTLDIKMPDGGGEYVYKKLQESEKMKEIPVIFISALPVKEIESKVLGLGAQHFMIKPFDSKKLVEKIKGILAAQGKKKGGVT